jgi:hypothetical protein
MNTAPILRDIDADKARQAEVRTVSRMPGQPTSTITRQRMQTIDVLADTLRLPDANSKGAANNQGMEPMLGTALTGRAQESAP